MTRHQRALLAALERTRTWTLALAAVVLTGLVLTCGPGPRPWIGTQDAAGQVQDSLAPQIGRVVAEAARRASWGAF